eukprot:11161744-Prorocentrum_lima.AAC.1
MCIRDRIYSDDQNVDEDDLPWIYFEYGDGSRVSMDTEAALVNYEQAQAGLQDAIAASAVQVANVRVTRTEDFYFGRTDNGGVWQQFLLDPDGTTSDLR